MSSGSGENSSEPDGLQFDHAEFDRAETPSSVACTACQRPFADHYFEINGTVVCDSCQHAIEAQLTGGSGIARFVQAALFGVGAAIIGTAIYATFFILSPIDLSLIAILVGFLVGKMVRKGGGGLGGLPYQLLAVSLTYASLAMTYFTAIMYAVLQGNKAPQAIPLSPEMVVHLLKLAFQTPVLRMSASPIQIAFVGFALWEAWKFNRRLPLVVTGPYRVGEMGPTEGVPANA